MINLLSEPLFYIYFVYGLSFLVMANFLAAEITGASSLTFISSFWMLVLFSITHGITEIVDWVRFMSRIHVGHDSEPLLYLSQIMLVVSFVCLLQFAINLLSYKSEKKGVLRSIPLLLFALFVALIVVQGISDIGKIGLFARYSFGFGGSLLSGIAFFKLGNEMKIIGNQKLVRGLHIAAIGFMCYAVFGGLIIQPLMGVPVQLFRAVCAVTITIASYMILDMFRTA